MLNERAAAARAVRETFLPAEIAQDEAAIEATRTLLTAMEARRQANLNIMIGADAIEHLSTAASLAVQARSAMIKAHMELASVPASIGLKPHMYGDTGERCLGSEAFAVETRPPHLTVAA